MKGRKSVCVSVIRTYVDVCLLDYVKDILWDDNGDFLS